MHPWGTHTEVLIRQMGTYSNSGPFICQVRKKGLLRVTTHTQQMLPNKSDYCVERIAIIH
jgi:hypothetical protein